MSLARLGPAEQHNAIASKPAIAAIRRATAFVHVIADPPALSNEFVTSIVPRSRAGSNSSLDDRLDALVIGCAVMIYPDVESDSNRR
jgi:hypothetical protein